MSNESEKENVNISSSKLTTSIKESPKNQLKNGFRVPVPEEDLRAALASIDNTIESICQSGILTKSDPTNGVSSVRDNCSKEAMQIEQLNKINNSLRTQIQSMVEPIPAKEYNDRYIRYASPLRRRLHHQNEDSSSSEDEDQTDEDDTSTEENNQELEELTSLSSSEESELDEEDLLDQDAIARARALRIQLRQAAERNEDLRDKQMIRAIQLAQKEMELHNYETIRDDFDFNDISEDQVDAKDSSSSLELERMQSSLRKLRVNLDAMDTELPDKLEMLQETIETIENSLAKQIENSNRKKNGEGISNEEMLEGLTGTERAILSRDNEGKKKTVTDTTMTGEENENEKMSEEECLKILRNMNPEKRFNLFMSNA